MSTLKDRSSAAAIGGVLMLGTGLVLIIASVFIHQTDKQAAWATFGLGLAAGIGGGILIQRNT